MFNQSTMVQLAKASRQAALMSLLGALVVVSSLIYSTVKLYSKQKELSALQEEVNKTQQKLDTLNQQVGPLNQQIDMLNQHIDSLNSQVDSKVKILKRLEALSPDLTDAVVQKSVQENNAIAPQVYIFTSDQSQQPIAERIADTLKSKGFQDIAIQSSEIGEKPQPDTQVRFFRYPEDKREAQAIVDILKNNLSMSDSRTAYVLPENAGPTEPRQFEIWLKKSPL